MLSDEQLSQIRPRIRKVQLAAAGMMMFVLVLLPVVCFATDWKSVFGPAKMLTLIAAIGALGMFAMAGVISKIFGIRPPKQGDENVIPKLVNSLSIESLIRIALVEGAVFLNLLVFMIEPHIVSLVAAGIGFLLMLWFFPRQGSISKAVSKWLDA